MNIFKLGTCTTAPFSRKQYKIGHILYRFEARTYTDENINIVKAS